MLCNLVEDYIQRFTYYMYSCDNTILSRRNIHRFRGTKCRVDIKTFNIFHTVLSNNEPHIINCTCTSDDRCDSIQTTSVYSKYNIHRAANISTCRQILTDSFFPALICSIYNPQCKALCRHYPQSRT